jgi:hypothetical protein
MPNQSQRHPRGATLITGLLARSVIHCRRSSVHAGLLLQRLADSVSRPTICFGRSVPWRESAGSARRDASRRCARPAAAVGSLRGRRPLTVVAGMAEAKGSGCSGELAADALRVNDRDRGGRARADGLRFDRPVDGDNLSQARLIESGPVEVILTVGEEK